MYAQKLKQETIDGLRLHIRTLRTSIDKLEAKLGEFEAGELEASALSAGRIPQEASGISGSIAILFTIGELEEQESAPDTPSSDGG